MKRDNRSLLYVGLIGLLPFFAAPAAADDAVLLENDASRCEIFRAISPDVPAECRIGAQGGLGRTRGIRLHDDEPAVATTDAGLPASSQQAEAAAPQSFAIAMRIQFEFDSAELTPESKSALGQVAQVLQDDLMRDKAILLEGHADATGLDAYNFDLSERRAASVRQYLVSAYGIDGGRLQAIGRGELEPYDPADPSASVNRRVEFTNLSD